ncbi:hypothetical protein [Paenibacillus ferrarius]|uniref:hypothetical protein n=1 Tax=Paenibacillus ferrarius TaxID=1469647 RepID=UPI001301A8CD|nr:hypothetical protein [Paenibacillus ferrarius]
MLVKLNGIKSVGSVVIYVGGNKKEYECIVESYNEKSNTYEIGTADNRYGFGSASERNN